MPSNPNKLSQFWQELKRRKVIHVITVYAGAAFVIIELINNVTEPLKLPEWTPTLVIIILLVGFPLAVIFSWIYDIHPEKGIVETKQASDVAADQTSKSSNSWKIASYVSFAVIVALIVLNIIPRANRKKISDVLEKSIAVLPFENMSSDEEYAHLGGAFTDEIIMELQKIKAFDRVLSRSSTMQYSENRPTIPEIAEKLNVNYLIEGSIQRHENDVYVRIQVIQAKPEDHVWGREYEGKWKDIISIQDRIAYNVANELRLVLTPDEKRNIDRLPTESIEAYNEYLLGKHFYYQHTRESLITGIEHFNNAIHIDTTFALAYVYFAYVYQAMVRYNWVKSDSVYHEVERAINKSIHLDQSLGEAQAALGLFKIVFDWDLYGPDEYFRKAIQLNPNSAEIFSSYAQYLRWMGRFDEGAVIAKRAIELDPVTPMTNLWLGAIYFYAGKYDLSIDHLMLTRRLDTTFIYVNAHLAYAYTMKKDTAMAFYYAEKAISGNIYQTSAIGSIGWVYAKCGESMKANEILNHLRLERPDQPIYPAMIYSGLGKLDKAIDLIYQAYESRSGTIIYLYAFANTFFQDLNQDPRFINLLREIGFKDR